MGSGSNHTLTITAYGKDQLSAPMRTAAESVKKLPESLSKAQAAMGAISGSSELLGTSFANVATKASGLVAMVGTGGPLGLGLAALAATLGVVNAAWEAHKLEVELTTKAMKSLDSVVASYQERAKKAAEAGEALDKQIANFGKTAQQIKLDEYNNRIGELSLGMENLTVSNEQAQAELEKLLKTGERYARLVDGQVVSGYRYTDAQKAQIESTQQIVTLNERKLVEMQKELDALGMNAEKLIILTKLEKDRETAGRRAEAAKRDAGEDRRAHEQALAAMLDEIDRIGAIEKARKKAAKEAADAEIEQQKRSDEVRRKSSQRLYESIRRQAEEDMIRRAALIQDLGGIWANVASQMASGQMSAAKSMSIAAVESVRTVIMAYAAEGAAAAFKAHAGIPFVGWAIGAALAGVVFAGITAYLGRAKFAQGGTVRGGVPGQDSVPILAMPDEEVLSVPEARRYRQARRDGSLYGGAGAGSRGGPSITFAPQIGVMGPMNRTQARRLLVSLAREMEDLVDSGMFLRNLARA